METGKEDKKRSGDDNPIPCFPVSILLTYADECSFEEFQGV